MTAVPVVPNGPTPTPLPVTVPPSDAVRPDDAASLRSTVVLLALSAFFSGAALRLCDGLLPRLALDFAVSPGTAGQVVLVFSLAYSLMQLLFGPLGDRFGKARMVTFALAGCALLSVVAALATGFRALLLARVAWGMAAAGIIPLAIAWIGDAVPYEQRQATLARLLLGTLSGMTAGQLAGGLFGDASVGWRGAFVAMALGYGAIAALLASRLGRIQALVPAAAAGPSREGWVAGLAGVLRARWNRRVLAATFLEGLFLLGPLAFLPAYLHLRFGLTLSQASGLIALYAVGGLAYAMVARRLLAAWGQRRMVRLGGWMMGLGYAAWWLSPVAWTAAPVALMVGFGTYLYHGTLQVLATQMATQSRGTAVSLFAFILFFGQAIGVTLAGLAFDHAGPAALLLVPALVLPVVGQALSGALARREARGEA